MISLSCRCSRREYLPHASRTFEGRVEGGVVARQGPLGLLAPVPKYQPLIPCLQVGEEQSEILGDRSIDSQHVAAFHDHGNRSWPGVAPGGGPTTTLTGRNGAGWFIIYDPIMRPIKGAHIPTTTWLVHEGTRRLDSSRIVSVRQTGSSAHRPPVPRSIIQAWPRNRAGESDLPRSRRSSRILDQLPSSSTRSQSEVSGRSLQGKH